MITVNQAHKYQDLINNALINNILDFLQSSDILDGFVWTNKKHQNITQRYYHSIRADIDNMKHLLSNFDDKSHSIQQISNLYSRVKYREQFWDEWPIILNLIIKNDNEPISKLFNIPSKKVLHHPLLLKFTRLTVETKLLLRASRAILDAFITLSSDKLSQPVIEHLAMSERASRIFPCSNYIIVYKWIYEYTFDYLSKIDKLNIPYLTHTFGLILWSRNGLDGFDDKISKWTHQGLIRSYEEIKILLTSELIFDDFFNEIDVYFVQKWIDLGKYKRLTRHLVFADSVIGQCLHYLFQTRQIAKLEQMVPSLVRIDPLNGLQIFDQSRGVIGYVSMMFDILMRVDGDTRLDDLLRLSTDASITILSELQMHQLCEATAIMDAVDHITHSLSEIIGIHEKYNINIYDAKSVQQLIFANAKIYYNCMHQDSFNGAVTMLLSPAFNMEDQRTFFSRLQRNLQDDKNSEFLNAICDHLRVSDFRWLIENDLKHENSSSSMRKLGSRKKSAVRKRKSKQRDRPFVI